MTSTPGALPVLTEDTRIKTDVKTLVGLASVLLGAGVWCTCTWRDIQELKDSAREKASQQDKMAHDLTALRDDVRRLTWLLEPASGSHAVTRVGEP